VRIPWALRRGQTDQDRDMETSTELSGSDLEHDFHLAPDNGIDVEPTPITLGDELKIEYRGLLAQSGAEAVYLHYGFGPGDWRFVQYIPMESSSDGVWTAVVHAGERGRFSFCFRDGADNWDNNSGRNWSYEIHGDDWH
jgi:hypothetical protein